MVSQFMATTALASTNDIHSHCICGKTNCTEEGHNGDLTWTAWDSADSLPTTSGNYYLTTDVTLTKPWDYNRNQDVNLCLNGHSIYGADEPDEDGSWVIRVASGTNLAITDCHTGDQVGKITYKNVKHGGINNNGTLALWNGSITGNAMLGLGGGVCNGGTFTMYGGNITGNSAYAGGGVYNDGAFTMSGGNICGNSSTSGGGGVYDNDTFTMTGGSITDNSSTGGVFIGEFAGYAGGVYVIGTLNLSGDAVIKDNKAGDTVSNVEIEIASTTVSRYGTVAVTGPMGKNASVGITATEPSEKLTVVKDTTNTDVFFSDDGTYTLVVDEANQVLYMVLTSSIPQEHKICGDATCQNQDHAILTWKAVWSLDDIKESGNYYLLSDLTLSNTWTCNYDVNLCLNGKTIAGPADNATIKVAAGSSLTITDCHTDDQVGKITHNNGEAGNGIFVSSNDDSCGTLTLWKGNITGNSAEYGGVENYGTLNLYGGSIWGNTANSYGGGVYNSGTLNIEGGNIAENTAGRDGGGVYISYGSLSMSSGSITDNSAGRGGGGIYISYGSLTMSGGSITDNSASRAGGVYNFGTFNLSGDVTIKDNTASNTANNVYLSNNKTITVAKTGMGDGASVGITAQTPGNSPVVVSNTADTTGFSSDNTNYELLSCGSSGLKLVQVHMHKICGDAACQDQTHDTLRWTAVSSLDSITKDGNYYLLSNVSLSDTWTCNYNVNLCLNGKTITGASDQDAIKIASGKSLTITDCQETVGKITHKNGDSGRGIYNGDTATLTIWNGSITGNSTKGQGGGVYNSGTLDMYGGSVTSNSAASNGGGVYNFGTFNLSGNVTIKDNTVDDEANNVYLPSTNETITVSETGMGDGASVGITSAIPGEDPIVVAGTSLTKGFFSDNGMYGLTASDAGDALKLVDASTIPHNHTICGKTECEHAGHTSLKWKAISSLDSITTDGNYYLLLDVTLSDTWTCNYNVNLCLNGKTITGASDQDAIKIASGKSLTITDCQETVGKITHKSGDSGRGIYNGDTGILTIWNGSITGNSTKGQGGGVYNSGTLDMYGGSVTSNSAASNGGGVYNFGTFNLSGNVTIKDNTVDDEANNVYLPSTNETITVSETGMGDGASVGITSAIPGEDPIVVAGTSLTKGFFSDNGMYGLTASDAGDALKLVDASTIPHNHTICGKTECEHAGHTSLKWKAISSLDSITTDGNYYLLLDVTLSDTWTCNYNVNLCLNGKTITGASDQDAIKIASGKSLTITDCQEAVGTITHKSGDSGRGIYNSGTLTLWNGTITKNAIKKQGGGVYNSGTLNMYGGSVTSNSATECAGGIYNNGTFTLSGNVIIKDNTVGDKPNNVYLPSTNETITVSETGMGDSASIGITSANPDSGAAVVTGTSDATYFSSDDTGYELVAIDGGGLKLSAKLVQISGVKLLVSDGGDEMATGQDGAKSKVYDGRAVAYDASAVVISPSTITGVTLSYTWQAKSGENYTDIADNEAPKDAGSYRLLVCAKRDDVVLGTFELPFTITPEEPIKPDSDKDKNKDETYDSTTDKSLVPATGDTSTATLPLALLGTAALATVLISGRRRRRR